MKRPPIFVPDPALEARMKSLPLPYETREICLGDVDLAESQHNNARLTERLNEETALEYAIAMEAGTPFPMPALWEKPGFRVLFTLAGNHRLRALQIRATGGDIPPETTFSAYVIPRAADPMLCEMLTRSDNRAGSKRQSKEEALEHARYMISTYNTPLQELARRFSLSLDWLRAQLRAETTRQKLGHVAANLPRASVEALGRLDPWESLQRKAANMAASFRMTAPEVRAMADEIRAAAPTSETDAVAAMKTWEARLRKDKRAQTDPARPRATPRSRLLTRINALYDFLRTGNGTGPFLTLDSLQVTDPHDRAAIRATWKALRRHVETLFRNAEALETVKGSKR